MSSLRLIPSADFNRYMKSKPSSTLDVKNNVAMPAIVNADTCCSVRVRFRLSRPINKTRYNWLRTNGIDNVVRTSIGCFFQLLGPSAKWRCFICSSVKLLDTFLGILSRRLSIYSSTTESSLYDMQPPSVMFFQPNKVCSL